jgi:hypothetical protein
MRGTLQRCRTPLLYDHKENIQDLVPRIIRPVAPLISLALPHFTAAICVPATLSFRGPHHPGLRKMYPTDVAMLLLLLATQPVAKLRWLAVILAMVLALALVRA